MLHYFKLLCICLFLLFSNSVFAQNYFYLGTGAAITDTHGGSPGTLSSPFGTYYEDNRTQYLILASELNALGANGELLSLAFDVQVAAQQMNGLNVKIGHTTVNSLNAYQSNLFTVYSGTVVPTTGWNNLAFNQPFLWDGTSNVVVEVCFDNTFWTSNSQVKYTPTSFNSVIGAFADGATGCNLNNLMGWGQDLLSRPNMRLQFSPPINNNASIGALLTPSLPTCNLGSSIAVELKNYGILPLTSANVNWSINGVSQTTVSWVGNLSTYADTLVSLGNVTGGIQDGDVLKVWSSLPNGVPDSSAYHDTLLMTLHSSLNGVYQITSSGSGDFLTINEAVSSLDSYGVCGPVVFELVDSLYSERIELETYIGMSDSNTVTFTSASGIRESSTVRYASVTNSDAFVFTFLDGSFYRFHDFTIENQGTAYSGAIMAQGTSEDIAIDNCVLRCPIASSTWQSSQNIIRGDGDSLADWSITNNLIEGGNYGIYMLGNWNNHFSNLRIEYNQILNPVNSAIYISNWDDLQINENHISSNSSYISGRGIYVNNAIEAQVNSNFIDGTVNWPRYGVYLFNIQGDLNQYAQLHNNRIKLLSYQASNGLFLGNSSFVEVAHNSFFVNGNSSSRGASINNGTYNVFKNNVIQNNGQGYGLYAFGNVSIYQCDHNVFSGTSNSWYWGNNSYSSLASWQGATSFDSNSQVVNQPFLDVQLLTTCNDSLVGMGTPLSSVTKDFEGDLRANPPTIGADEFIPYHLQQRITNVHLCDGDTFSYDYSAFDTVVWNSQTQSPTYNVHSGPQVITVYAVNQCGSFNDTINVTIQDFVTLQSDSFCADTSLIVDAGISNATYLWSNGQTFQTILVDSIQTIWVQVTDTFGCSSSDTASFFIRTPPYIALQSDSFCGDTSLLVDAGAGLNSYLWSTGDTSQTVVVDSTQQLWVNVTDSFGCSSSDTASYSIIPLPTASFTFNLNFLTAHFTSSVQNADPSTTYFWDFGDGFTSTDPNPIHVLPWTVLDTVQVVTLTVTNSCGSSTFSDTLFIAPNSVQENTGNLFNVYPNPTESRLVIQPLHNGGLMHVSVYDTKGALLVEKQFGAYTQSQTYAIDMSPLSAGMYVVQIMANDQRQTFKISKQ